MAMREWIHRYPQVQALLQQDGDVVEGVSSEGPLADEDCPLLIDGSVNVPRGRETLWPSQPQRWEGLETPWPSQPQRWEGLEAFTEGAAHCMQFWGDWASVHDFWLYCAADVYQRLQRSTWHGAPVDVVAWMPAHHWAVHWHAEPPSSEARGLWFVHHLLLCSGLPCCITPRPSAQDGTSICRCGGLLLSWR